MVDDSVKNEMGTTLMELLAADVDHGEEVHPCIMYHYTFLFTFTENQLNRGLSLLRCNECGIVFESRLVLFL